MRQRDWLTGIRAALGRAPRRSSFSSKRHLPNVRWAQFESLEDRRLLAVDFGDAPDTSLGTGSGNYNTLSTDNGPQHTIVVGLQMGANVDGDDGALQNSAANADDVNGALPDDEDGLTNPADDLVLTIGGQPRVNVWVTNTTGTAATLYGWIDYNANGVFENATERASVPVPSGTSNLIGTLVFPNVPAGFTGTTYARFRLSTDFSAADPTGAATDGEVEDYQATIVWPTTGEIDGSANVKIGDNTNGGLDLSNGDRFGSSVAGIGDLDGDGTPDLAVGTISDDTGGSNRGAVRILFLNPNGTVKSSQKIADGIGGGPVLVNGDQFGSSVASLGDLDGDGVTDLAVGAHFSGTGGAVYVLFLNSDGTVKSSQRIASGVGGGPILLPLGQFGSSVGLLGDLDGDGVNDLAVGAYNDYTGGIGPGAVYVLFLNSDGTVKSSQKIASGVGGGPVLADNERFGRSIASLSDLDGDGVTDLAVGAFGYGFVSGSVHVLLLNSDGTVKSSQRIANGINGGPELDSADYFGRSVASVGDFDGDGIHDLAVGADGDDPGGASFSNQGALYLLYLTADGTAKGSTKIANNTVGGPTLEELDHFGISVTSLGNLDGGGRTQIAVGARDGAGSPEKGAVHVLTLAVDNPNIPVFTSPSVASVVENTTTVMTVTATDADGPAQTVTFSIVGGADQDKFEIAADGVLTFNVFPDFELPTDADGNNEYVVTVEANDRVGGKATQTINVSVTPINDNLPFFTSPDVVSVAENRTAVLNVTANDADLPPQAITFSIVGGLDQAKFGITTGGALSFISPPEFDTPTDSNGDNVYVVTVQVDDGNGGTAAQTINITVLDTSFSDFGDAPDSATGTGPGNYNTRSADNGPLHSIVVGLRMGASVDIDNGVLQNGAANADDVDGALPDDEDGLANPAADLAITVGAQPTISAWATNTTGAAAMIYGWIDYDANGVFDNSSERASAIVPDGSNNILTTLVFPAVPSGFTGTTYARFRLSTDAAAANPTGFAADGEVEDYQVKIAAPINSAATIFFNTSKIAQNTNGGPALANSDYFGGSLASIGDLDGDGVTDLAVGAVGDDTNGSARGAVHVLFMNVNGSVKSIQKISSNNINLANGDYFGSSVASLGDLDGDGVTDLIVGAERDDSYLPGASNRGAVHILFLNPNGTVKNGWQLGHGDVTLADGDYFGSAVTSVGDLDGDGVSDVAVGSSGDNAGGADRGAVHVLFLNPDGTLKSSQKIGSGIGGGPVLANSDRFGTSLASLGDLDGDGVTELAVGAAGDSTGGNDRGAVHVLFMNTNGTVKSSQKIASGVGGGPTLVDGDQFGAAVAAMSDLDGDGVKDLAVGANYDDTGGNARGAAYLLLLNANGTVKSSKKIASGTSGGPTLANDDHFGASLTSPGDLNGDGRIDLVVGADFNDTGGTNRGAAYVLSIATNTNPVITSPNTAFVPENTSAALNVVVVDAESPPQIIQFSLIDGPDKARFAINNAGLLFFNPPPDFEAPTDANGDNVYLVTVQASDGAGGTVSQMIAITVTPVDDNALTFTSPTTAVVPENTTSVMTVTAVDADLPAQSLTYSIVGGADQNRFEITTGGILSFVSAPDFEAPSDANGDNIYSVVVQVSDGNVAISQTIDVTISPVNEHSPVFTSPSLISIPENTTSVLTVIATDADLPAMPISYSIIGGADQARFNISSRGALSFNSPPSFQMPTDSNGDNVYEVSVRAGDGAGGTTTQMISVTVTSSTDYGDAPDASAGTGPGNYNTRAADNGPSHTIVLGLRLGTTIDGNEGTLQNVAANADDINGPVRDDEDGLTNPDFDLALTVGTQPMVNVWVTNVIGAAATLYGWIDYNNNGIFDNATERASVVVPNGTNNGIVQLVFPTVSADFTGTTYARFRLSTDAAAANPTGAAADGEVEDYRAAITVSTSGMADSSKTKKIAHNTGGGPVLGDDYFFGSSLTAAGDIDGDGVTDLAVGGQARAYGSNPTTGTVHVFLMNADGTIKSTQKIGSGIGGGPTLAIGDYFGRSVASLGDLDGDGTPDLAVGSSRDDTGGNNRGAVHVLFMNANGTVKNSQKIASGVGGSPTLANGDQFGSSVESLGDLDGDGVTDLAVGAIHDATGGGAGSNRGAVHVLFMNANGTVKSSQIIASSSGGGPALANGDYFGLGVASLGDIDGDGINDLAVGVFGDDTGGNGRGAVYVLFMNSNGTVKGSQKIASGVGGGPTLVDGSYFGRSVAAVGDLDGDGANDLAVGAARNDAAGGPGTVYLLSLNANGTVKNSHAISSSVGGGPTLSSADRFGSSVASLGDLDGDGVTDIAVGAERDDTGGTDRGAIYVMFLNRANSNPVFTSPNSVNVAENTTSVMNVTATDADLPAQTITFSIVGGADQARFGITVVGALSFNSPPDFEAPADADTDNVYVVSVRASDGNGGMATQTITVTVTPINDNSPIFTSADTVSVAENSTAILNVSATDADLPAQTVTFSLAGGADQGRFGITSGGALSFNTPPDFESPTDSNGDNLYVVIVQASDGGLMNLQAILINVLNVPEPTGDFNSNGAVENADLTLLLNNWAAPVPPTPAGWLGTPLTAPAVDNDELTALLNNWGATTGAGSASTAADLQVSRVQFGQVAGAGAGSGAESAMVAPELVTGSVLATRALVEANVQNVSLAAQASQDRQVDSTVAPRILDRRVTHRQSSGPTFRRSLVTAPQHDVALLAWLTSNFHAKSQHDFVKSISHVSTSDSLSEMEATSHFRDIAFGRWECMDGITSSRRTL